MPRPGFDTAGPMTDQRDDSSTSPPAPDVPFIELVQHGTTFLLARIPAGRLAAIAYAAIRGRDVEPGSVQRVLNPERIAGIKRFTLQGGAYPASFVLNWTSDENPLIRNGSTLHFRDEPGSAQLIDGQHRLAGIREAILENPELARMPIPAAIYEGLDTRRCADIFLSINTEQRPVPKSLVYDLYGVATRDTVDNAAIRALDIATYLHEEKTSPYYEDIKFPGGAKRKGGIALSTAVSAIKPLVESKGVFEQIGVTELQAQKVAIMNFFYVIAQQYGDQAWWDKSNAFRYAAGFTGGIEFFSLKLIPYCNAKRSFRQDTISSVLRLRGSSLILQDEVKGLGGTDAVRKVFERLTEAFSPEDAPDSSFAF